MNLLLYFFSIYVLATINASPIVGGRNATTDEYKYIVSLKNLKLINKPWSHSGHFCGGSILNKDWIVTAAHCFYDWKIDNEPNKVDEEGIKKDVIIHVGNHELVRKNPKTYYIKDLVVHPDWNRFTRQNDIALIRVTDRLKFNDNEGKIRLLDDSNLIDLIAAGKTVAVAGWGFTTTVIDEQVTSDWLKVLNVKIIELENCMERDVTNLNSWICIRSPKGEGFCDLDSGGPVTVKSDDGTEYLAGVISHGEDGNCAEGKPDRVSSIPFHLKWIERVLRMNDPWLHNYYLKKYKHNNL